MTELVAVVMSWWFLLLGFSLLLQARRWATWIKGYAGQADDPYRTLLMALFLLVGLVVIGTHNIWVLDWPVAITVFGWGMVAEWVLLTVAPAAGKAIWRTLGPGTVRVLGAVGTVLGAILVYRNVLSG